MLVIQNPHHSICLLLEPGIKTLLASHMFLDLAPMPPHSFSPCCLSHSSQLQLVFGNVLTPFHAHPSPSLLRWLALPAGSVCGSGQPLIHQMLMQS